MYFRDIIGQSKVKERLWTSANNSRIPHAQLFLGPEGSGNLAMAIAYARYILCNDRMPQDACGVCPTCLKIDKLVHPDLHFSFPVILSSRMAVSNDALTQWREAVLEEPYLNTSYWYQKLGEEKKQGVINVKESDEIVKKLALKSFEGGYKIMIIWMPELLNISASNKLLKILEEPPAKTLFLLVANDQEQLIQTILSRTQLVKMSRLSDEEVTSGLLDHMSVDGMQAPSIGRIADGNYLKAKTLVREGEADHDNFNLFRDWMRLCFRKDVKGAVNWVDELAGLGRERQKSLLNYGLHLFRECLVGNYSNEDLVRLDGEEMAFSGKFSNYIKSGNILPLYEEFNTAHYHVERNANPKILFLDLSFKVFKWINK
jgi:DNA polymerase-3 subunit delta'